MELLGAALQRIDHFVWGPGTVCLLLGTGVFFTFRLRFLPWRNLGAALRSVFGREARRGGKPGEISPFSSLMTALAATVGTGNLVGVATAMAAGGPGALVWMWISALFGMATKYAECLLAVKYREKNSRGEWCGGPMYTLRRAFCAHPRLGRGLGLLFAGSTVLASFGIGCMTQANSISAALLETFAVPQLPAGVLLSALVFLLLLGGIRTISKVSSALVPAMAVLYFLAGGVCLGANLENLPSGLSQLFQSAFSVKAACGGAAGTLFSAVRFGTARGIFSNEAGLGSAAITAAASSESSPAKQGYFSMTGTFFDTLVVCSVTGLVLACSGVLEVPGVQGAGLTVLAFRLSFTKIGGPAFGAVGAGFLCVCIVLFAFSTILGWSYYGEKALEFFAPGRRVRLCYRALYSLCVCVGAVGGLSVVWAFSDIANACMALPNLLSLWRLQNTVARETFAYEETCQISHKNAPKSRAKRLRFPARSCIIKTNPEKRT